MMDALSKDKEINESERVRSKQSKMAPLAKKNIKRQRRALAASGVFTSTVTTKRGCRSLIGSQKVESNRSYRGTREVGNVKT